MRVLARELVGRRAELRTLETTFAEAARGKLQLALVSGPAGIGKSALLREFTAAARRSGAQVLVAESAPEEGSRPFGPFLHVSGGVFGDALAPIAADRPSLFGPPQRLRPFDAIASRLRALARDRPVVLVLEDAQWADEESLGVLPYLARRAAESALLVAASYRTEDAAAVPLATALAELRRRHALEVDVPPLTTREVGALIREALELASPPSFDLRSLVAERSGGSPLLVEELLRALIDQGVLVRSDGTWREAGPLAGALVPTSVRDSVRTRLTGMTEGARHVLSIAAVIGQRFGFELLVEVAERPPSAVVEALRAGIDSQLVDETRTERLGYAFRHALTRDAILLELLAPERRELHRVIAHALESRAGDDIAPIAPELAFHFDESGDVERAVRYHFIAAQRAYALGAQARAGTHLERALSVASAGHPDRLEMASLYVWAGGDPAKALAADEVALEHAVRSGDERSVGRAMVHVGVLRSFVHDPAGATSTIAEGIRRLEPFGPSEDLAGGYYALAREASLADRSEEAIPLAERAIEQARLAHAPTLEAGSIVTLGTALGLMGRSEGPRLIREAVQIGRTIGDGRTVTRGLDNLWSVLVATAAPDDEVREVERSISAVLDRDAPIGLGLHAIELHGAFFDARWDDAFSYAGEFVNVSPYRVPVDLVRAFIGTAREGPDAWRTAALAARERQGTELLGYFPTGLAVEIMYMAGDMPAALDAAMHVARLQDSAYGSPLVDSAAATALAAALASDDPVAIESWLDRCERTRAPEAATAEGRRAFARGERALREGRPDVALEEFARSAAGFERRGATLLARTLPRLRRAELLAPSDPRAAQRELAAVMAMWRAVDAKWYLGRLREWAAAHGLRASAPAGPRGARLTPREVEVARLVAEGLTNKEIGGKLAISERTAETHVQRILTKLDLRGRAQLAAWIAAAPGAVQTRM